MDKSFYLILIISTGLLSCGPKLPADVEVAMADLPEEIDYNIHVKPILSDKCFACHGPDAAKQKAGLRIDVAEAAYGELPENLGKYAIDPGDLNDSEIFHRIISEDPDYIMPSPDSHLTLSSYEKAVLIRWIKEGAVYKTHWAFVKPEKSDIPDVKNEDWVKSPIDNFILKKLEDKKLKPSKEADIRTLLRRVTFDLTGLPPTIAEQNAFLNDKSKNAYAKVVDRLLASTAYGERMTVDWLDLARFADSHGYTVDRIRDMSPYRDWVIKAFNKNMPYDEFVTWQLAGDLMPNPSKEMLIATGFNRNHQQNMEGGIIEEEFQTEYVVDRTNTLGDAFLGLSLGCAKCHDHKFDPISQKEYYQFYSFFNNVREAGQISWDDTMPSPTLMLPNEEEEKLINFITKKLTSKEKQLEQLQKSSAKDFNGWLNSNQKQSLGSQTYPTAGLIGKYDFDKNGLSNAVNPKQKCYSTLEYGAKEKEKFTEGKTGKGILLNGDAWLDFNEVGVFSKSDPFTISIAVKIPAEFKEGVIFHKSLAERLYNFKGFHVYGKADGTLEATMAHAAPSNAITKVSKQKVIKGQWITLALSYDGSSKASGINLFMDGKQLEMITEIDELKKDILLKEKVQPGLQIGGWYRGFGLKNGIVDNVYVYNRELTPFEIGILAGKSQWKNIVNKDIKSLSAADKNTLSSYFFSAVHKPSIALKDSLQAERTTLARKSEQIKEVMVMRESPKPKQAYILNRGNYDALGEKVFPNTPKSILPMPKNLPKNRYGLAQWLTNPDHPLTARVAVNRIWQNIFGVGLVKTSEDFGNQGEMPSHPKLLDYLAVEFIESGWDVKKMVKEMVLSAAYQQDSKATKQQLDNDKENRFLARGPAGRLSAEMMRDNALAASGLLKNKIGGPSVKPYQPDGLWRINGASYVPDTTDDVYRRSLYVIIKRSVPHPTIATFDGVARSFCVIRRQKTNTPLQALVTLNDPTYVEVSKVLGERMAKQANAEKAIIEVYNKLTGKMPKPNELSLLLELQSKELKKFRGSKNKTIGWLDAGYYTVDSSMDSALIAANAVVANVILNSDATLTKR
jgi:hypothetical protein